MITFIRFNQRGEFTQNNRQWQYNPLPLEQNNKIQSTIEYQIFAYFRSILCVITELTKVRKGPTLGAKFVAVIAGLVIIRNSFVLNTIVEIIQCNAQKKLGHLLCASQQRLMLARPNFTAVPGTTLARAEDAGRESLKNIGVAIVIH